MKELFSKLEEHLVTHLWDIERDIDEHSGLKCPQQIDDIKDALCSIKTMHEILKMYP